MYFIAPRFSIEKKNQLTKITNEHSQKTISEMVPLLLDVVSQSALMLLIHRQECNKKGVHNRLVSGVEK